MNVNIDISDVVLHTERLTIRPWKQSDAEDLYAYASVDGVGQMAGWKPHENLEESKKILKMFIDGKKTFALEYQEKVIGSIGIEEYSDKVFPEFDAQKGREIGYVLSKEYWGRGLTPEAVKEVIRYLFEDLDLDFLFCTHFPRNLQSARVQEKCGFVHYGYERRTTILGNDEDLIVNIILKEKWLQK